MTAIQCKICGGLIELPSGRTLGECPFCGSQVTLPVVTDETHAAAFNRGNHFRRIGEFDKALAVYERIVQEDEGNAEAHWCSALCRFGIEYVKDPATGEYLPTCHRASYDSFLEDVDYLAALAHADDAARAHYQRDAEQIAQVQRGILAVSQSEKPFDVFLCYKETDANGQRTRDSQLAQDVYYQLTDQGLRVFFARITLEDKPGTQFEPYIFAALNTAKVMVVVGTKPEHLSATWVRNEWSRYLAIMKRDRTRLLIPCYRDMDPYDMPEQLSILQGYDMSRIGFIQDLVRGIRKVVGEEKPAAPAQQAAPAPTTAPAAPATEPLLRRVGLFLEDGDWQSADEYCERVLDIDPENAQAYLGKLMAALRVTQREKLKDQAQPFDQNPHYAKVLRFADEALAAELQGTIAYINKRNTQAAFEAAYSDAMQTLVNAKAEQDYINARYMFEALGGWRDAAERAQECETKRKDWLYQQAEYVYAAATTEQDFANAQTMFENLGDHRDAAARARECNTAQLDCRYDQAVQAMTRAQTASDFDMAQRLFASLDDWRDASEKAAACRQAIRDFAEREAAERAERQRLEEAARRAAQEAARRRKRNIGIGTAVVALLTAIVLLVTQVIIPNGKYNDAVQMMKAGRYEEAIEVFDELNGYRDSAAQIKACNAAIMDPKYDAAVALMSAGKYEEAIEAFEAMNGYRDSAAQIEACNTAIKDGKYDAAVALMSAGKYEEAIEAFEAMNGYRDSAAQIEACNTAIKDGKYDAAVALMSAGKYEEAIEAFEALKGYRDSAAQIKDCNYVWAEKELADGNTALAAMRFGASGAYKDASARSSALWAQVAERHTIAAGNDHTVGLRADGTVVAVGRNKYGQCNVSGWQDVVAIAAGDYHTVGLRADSTVVAVGRNDDGRCDVSGWRDVVAIAAGDFHTVGLRADDTVVAVGYNDAKQCDVSGWSDVVAIAAGRYHTVGLRTDGTVVAVGDNDYGQCDVSGWSDVVAIAAGDFHTVGLRADGTVVAVGYNYNDECDVSGWRDIVAISAGSYHTVGLRADGTVVAVGYNYNDECDVSGWRDVVVIAAGNYHTVGLRADGTVIAVGYNLFGQCDVTDWQLMQIPRPTLPQ